MSNDTSQMNLIIDSEKKIKEPFSYGLAILRIIVCIDVIAIHYAGYGYSGLPDRIILNNAGVSVPVFMILAFFFTDPYFLAKSNEKLKRRVIAIYLPLVFWGGAYWVMYRLINLFFHADLRDGIQVLFFQLLLGSDINPVFWFNFDLIVLVLISIMICKGFRNRYVSDAILIILALICLVLEWTGTTYQIFDGVRYEVYNPVMRLFQMMPFAVLGTFLGRLVRHIKSVDIEKIFKTKVREIVFKSSIILVFILLWFFVDYPIMSRAQTSYLSVENLVLAPLAVLIFDFIGCDRLADFVKRTIRVFSSRTLGAYGMHIAVGKVICYGISKAGIRIGSFLLCFIIFLVCSLLGEIMIKVFGNRMKAVV